MAKGCYGASRKVDNDPISGGKDLDIILVAEPGPVTSLHVFIILIWGERGIHPLWVREPEAEGVALMMRAQRT